MDHAIEQPAEQIAFIGHLGIPRGNSRYRVLTGLQLGEGLVQKHRTVQWSE